MNLTAYLDQQGVTYRTYHHDETFDAQHMAQSIHLSGHMVAKTVLVHAVGGANCFVLVVPAAERVDLRRVSAILGGVEVRLATEAEILEHATGFEFGIVPIFGSQFGLQTIIDESLSHQDELVFQGQTHEETVRMKFADFYRLEHPRIATIVQHRPENKLAS
ncbi:MAG TPA: YbaK/EbsC family protein [Candidatus Acidoferrum sp.]|nr:YbaK/EbsC family protein [Candidatus Acidoferrum sp.]